MFENLLSFKNEYANNKKYKVVKIMGVKFKHTLQYFAPNIYGDKLADIENIYGSEFVKIYNEIKPYTMITRDAAYANYKIINYLEANNIQGDIVECGVWKGGSCMLMMKTLMKRGNTSRKFYLYDTFDGMSEPTDKDNSLKYGKSAITIMQEMSESGNYSSGETNWCQSGIDEVKANIEKTNYPLENIVFTKGKVEDTLPVASKHQIAFLRLDTDWYESTKIELECLYPDLVSGGVLLLDDYYWWSGSRQATDEYFQKINKSPLMIKVDSNAISVKS